MNPMLLLSNAEFAENVAEKSGGLDIVGPLIVWEFKLFGVNWQITESVTVQWLALLLLGTLFFILGRNLKVRPEGKRQALAEMIVGMFSGLVKSNMGPGYFRYAPYIGALFCFSLTLSLTSLLGFRPPTADISVIGAWGILTFLLVQRNRFKTGGVLGGLKSFTDPIPVILPLNLVSEIANPVSQSFRHYGNVLAGVIIGSIIYWGCGNLSNIIIGLDLPLFLPALTSIYFDIFAGILQAFVFVMLTMVYVSMADCASED